MKLVRLALVCAILAVGCTATAPFAGFSRAAAPAEGSARHTCPGTGGYCDEGYACTKDGCEWCGDDDMFSTETRCSAGND